MPSDEKTKYWAFISYSHADKPWGDWLHRALETYRVPRRLSGTSARDGKFPSRLFPVFRDREELPTSADLGGNLRTALEQSRFLVVVCSPRAAASRWVNEEIRTFQRLGGSNRILALVVAGEPNASYDKPGFAAEAECFPPALRFQVGEAGELTSTPAEPVAADARPGKDGRAKARLKLIAGILGVGLDDLWQRERQRQRRRRVSAAAVVLAVVATFATLWLWQEAKRRAAQEQAARERVALVDRRTADEAEERGRQLLLTGDADAASRQLTVALAAAPDRASVRLMLDVAERGRAGLVSMLRAENNEKITDLALDPAGTRLLAIGNFATLWDVPGGQQLRRIAPGNPGQDALSRAEFSASGDRLLLQYRDTAVLQEVVTGKETFLPNDPSAFLHRYRFLGDGSRLLSCEGNPSAALDAADQKQTGSPLIVRILSQDGRELRRFNLGPGSPGDFSVDRAGRTAVVGWWRSAPAPPGVQFWVGEPRLTWFEVDTGKVLADLPRNAQTEWPMSAYEVSGDGSRLISVRPDGTCEVRTASGDVLGTTRPAHAELSGPSVQWAPDGQTAAITLHGVTTLSDATLQQVRWRGVFSSFAFDPSGALLAYSSRGGVCVVEAATGKELAVFQDRIGWPDLALPHDDMIVRFSADGRRLLLAGSGNAVKVWDWRRARSDLRVVGDPKESAPSEVVFSSDGQLFAAVAPKTGEVLIRETASGLPRGTVATQKELGGAWTVAFRPEGGALLVGAGRPEEPVTATLWDTADGKLLGRLNDEARIVSSFSTTSGAGVERNIRVAWGKHGIVTANFNVGRLFAWDGQTYDRRRDVTVGPGTMEISPGPAADQRLALSGDGRRVIVGGFDNIARVYALDDLRLLAELSQHSDEAASPPPAAPKSSRQSRQDEVRRSLNGVALSFDGTRALTFDLAGRGVVWEVANGQKLASPEVAGVVCNALSLSPDGKLLAGACSDGSVRLWDAATGATCGTLQVETPPGSMDYDLPPPSRRSGFLDVRFDPGGLWVAGIEKGGSLCLWERASGRQLLRWKLGPNSDAGRLQVSEDGHQLAVYGTDGAVRFIDVTPFGSPAQESTP